MRPTTEVPAIEAPAKFSQGEFGHQLWTSSSFHAGDLKEYMTSFDQRIIAVSGSPESIAAIARVYGAKHRKVPTRIRLHLRP